MRSPPIHILLFVVVLCACTNLPQERPSETMANEAPMASAVSARANFNPSRQATLALPREIAMTVDPRLAEDSPAVEAMRMQLAFVRTRLLRELASQKSFMFSDVASCDYLVDARIIMGNAFGERELVREFGIAPQLAVAEGVERSTLIVLIRNLRNQILWRGAVQLPSTTDLDEGTTKERMAVSVAALVNQIPAPE